MDTIDTWTTEQDGITYRISIVVDDDQEPDDDGMRDETREALERGDWLYVGVIVAPLIDGVDVSDSLWKVEWGELPPTSAEGIPADDPRYGPGDEGVSIGREYITSVHPVPDMISEIRGQLRKLRDTLPGKLAALNLDD